MNVFNYNFAALTGGALALERFRSQPILLVNTASKCGFTSHYAQLQQLHNDYQQSGLVVIGMPCNDFGEQEPDSEEEIAEFVRTEYNVTFPMTAKYSVIGINAHPLFKDLAQEHGGAVLPRWKFHKYLFNRKGALVEHWPAQTPPDDPAVTHQLARKLQAGSR
ncbi:MAG: glutathione peroxidase [Wenzhouxiangella sp.]|nr:glutathione peroxidase [Wenzhouxiangella sp.]